MARRSVGCRAKISNLLVICTLKNHVCFIIIKVKFPASDFESDLYFSIKNISLLIYIAPHECGGGNVITMEFQMRLI